jgi:glycosyltransferase involved in cell wall biosynthesis
VDVLFIDTSTKLDTVTDLETRARGGMINSLITLSGLLSDMGHSVTVASDIKKGGKTLDGVWWPVSTCDLTGYSWDVMICNRGIGDGFPHIRAKRRVLWTHDLPHNGFIEFPKMMQAFAATIFMSRYAESVWRTFYRTIGRSFQIPNGVDKSTFYPRPEKDYNYLIYASAPNRGLKRLPLILDAIRTRLTQNVYMRAFSNLAILHPNEVDSKDNGNGDGFEMEYQSIRESAVELHDPLPKYKIAQEIGRAGAMIIPTDYPEICSNIILQSLASGTPVITTGNLGSAAEWITHGRNGMLTQFHPVDYMVYQVEMVRNAVEILSDRGQHLRMVKKTSNTRIHSWEEIASKWDRMLKRIY